MIHRIGAVVVVWGWGGQSSYARRGFSAAAGLAALLAFSSPALAQSCADVDAAWGSGITLSGLDNELWFDVNLVAGETLTYTATSTGSTNTELNYSAGGGFALYSPNPSPNNVILENYAWAGSEIAFGPGAQYTAPESGPYVIYAWSGSSGATVNAQVTCMPAPPAPTIITAPTNKVVDVGGDTVFTVVAENTTSYQWQYNAGAGYINISNGGVYSGATSASLTITGATAAMNGYAYRVVVVGPTAPQMTSSGAMLTVNKLAQTITFENPGSQTFGTSPLLEATSSSNLGVSFSSATAGVCTTTAVGELTFVTAGTCTINADQVGDATYSAATQVQQSFSVAPTVPGAPTSIGATPGDTEVSVAFTPPSSTGGAAIDSYVVTASPGDATGSGPSSPIVVDGLTNGTSYTFTVTAINGAGEGPASVMSTAVTPQGSQSITFPQPADQPFGSTPTLSASSTSGLDVTFTSSTTGVCTTTSGGELTFVAVGVCTINADQAGDLAYSAALTETRSFNVQASAPAAPVMGAATAGEGRATVTFTAPSNNGGSPITYYTVTSSPGDWTNSGMTSPITVATLTNGVAYTFTVTATNSIGTSPASSESNSVTPATLQDITFTNPGAQNFGTSPTLMATASSDLPVTFSSATPAVCTASSLGVVTFITAGTCTIDANQAGDTEFLPAHQVSQTFTVNPVLPGAPTIGEATAGDKTASVTFTAPLNTGGVALTNYTVTTNPADVAPINGAASPILISGLTNGQAYTFTVSASNVVGGGAASAASNSVTPATTQTITFSNPGAMNFGTTPQLSATSDSGLDVVFTSASAAVCTITSAGQLTFVRAGTCVINADQAGNGSYLPADRVTQTFTVNAIAPAAPVIGVATAGDGEASVAFTAPISDGGSDITLYRVTSNPGNIMVDGPASPITFGGLQNGVDYTFSVTALNVAGEGVPSASSNSVTPAPALLPPVVGPIAETVAANSTDNSITLAITSDVAATVSVTAAPSHGTATPSGQTILYTPNAGYFGTDSFEYAATNAAGTSPSATVTITVNAPPALPTIASITPAEKLVTDNMVYATITGTGLQTTQSVVFGAVHGSNLTIVSDTEISIMTPHNLPGVYDVTVNTANGSVTAPSAFTVRAPLSVPTVSVSASTDNPTLGAQVTFTATLSGGSSPTGAVTFKDGHTSLGTATLTGGTAAFSTPALAVGPHSITAEYAGDANNAAATSAPIAVTVAAPSFTFTPPAGALSQAMAGEQYSQSISATGGTGTVTYSLVSGALPKGMVLNVSTGELTGPLAEDAEVKDYNFEIQARDGNGATGTAAYVLTVLERVVTVSNKQVAVPAGLTPTNVNLTLGATGGPFILAEILNFSPANAGAFSIVRGELAQLGAAEPLGWYLKFTPNPAFSGQVDVQFRLTSALGISNTGVVTYTMSYDPASVAADINERVHGFVQSRQGLIANTVQVPGLLNRRQMAASSDAVTARMMPSESGITSNFSTSLAQMNSAGRGEEALLPFNFWIDGTFMLHNRDQNGSRWGSFGMVSAGADYLLSDKALIGLSFHYDRMTDPTDGDAELTGNGWLAGPYASFEIGEGVFWDTSLLYGGSANKIDTALWDGSFDTRRWLFDTSLNGQWQLDEDTFLTPKLRAVYFSEKVDDYAVDNGAGGMLNIPGFTEEQLRISLGAEIARRFTLENGSTVTPKLGLTAGFSGLDGSGAFGQLAAGVTMETPADWNLDVGLRLNVSGNGEKSMGGRAGIRKRF